METTQTGEAGKNGHARVVARTHDLDSLAAMDVEALGRLYAKGTCPSRLDVLEGHPRGRMLSVKTLDRGPVFKFLKSFAAASKFPWGGKSFRGKGETGEGVNRVHLG